MKKSDAAPDVDGQLRRSAEAVYAHEIDALAAEDERARPARWRLSPQAVVTYLMGGNTRSGVEITAKYIGNRRLSRTLLYPDRKSLAVLDLFDRVLTTVQILTPSRSRARC
jgi:hypothetical protein